MERSENFDELTGLESSQQTYGVREYELSSDFFQLTIEQCQDLAKGTVDALIRPVTRFNLDLSVWNQFAGLTPDQIGKKIILPNALEGVLSDFAYSDDYAGDTPVVSCLAEITV
ncbi:MAG: hypothetical protein HC855_04750, partial [Rhizobiales bacterium]|nr:hypothetical protein [Hyphomicrobiales bacterium]